MKKTIIFSVLALFISAVSYCQMPPTGGVAGKLVGFDSTLSSVKDSQKDYKYITPYCIVNGYTVTQSATDSVAVMAVVLLYASPTAYQSKLQPVTSIRMVVKLPVYNSKLPDQQIIKQQIYGLIPKQ